MLTKLYVKATTALKSDEGATAVEYAILVALIAAVLAGAAAGVGPKITTAFKNATTGW
jgi:Flp pilus assembly pilin Flp